MRRSSERGRCRLAQPAFSRRPLSPTGHCLATRLALVAAPPSRRRSDDRRRRGGVALRWRARSLTIAGRCFPTMGRASAAKPASQEVVVVALSLLFLLRSSYLLWFLSCRRRSRNNGSRRLSQRLACRKRALRFDSLWTHNGWAGFRIVVGCSNRATSGADGRQWNLGGDSMSGHLCLCQEEACISWFPLRSAPNTSTANLCVPEIIIIKRNHSLIRKRSFPLLFCANPVGYLFFPCFFVFILPCSRCQEVTSNHDFIYEGW